MDAKLKGERNQEIRKSLLVVPKFGDDEPGDAHQWVHRVLELYVNALRATEPKTPPRRASTCQDTTA